LAQSGLQHYKTLEKHVVERGIQALFRHNLISLNPEKKEATFEHLETKANADGWVEEEWSTI
jgi:hypothetical protein